MTRKLTIITSLKLNILKRSVVGSLKLHTLKRSVVALLFILVMVSGTYTAFALPALILNFLLYQSKLVPRWLSSWGFVGAALVFANFLLESFGNDPIEILYIPIAVQEMVFAVWLIVKGFNPSAISSEPA